MCHQSSIWPHGVTRGGWQTLLFTEGGVEVCRCVVLWCDLLYYHSLCAFVTSLLSSELVPPPRNIPSLGHIQLAFCLKVMPRFTWLPVSHCAVHTAPVLSLQQIKSSLLSAVLFSNSCVLVCRGKVPCWFSIFLLAPLAFNSSCYQAAAYLTLISYCGLSRNHQNTCTKWSSRMSYMLRKMTLWCK